MAVSKLGLQPADQRRIGEQRIKIDRCLRHGDRMGAAGNGAVEIGQRLGVA